MGLILGHSKQWCSELRDRICSMTTVFSKQISCIPCPDPTNEIEQRHDTNTSAFLEKWHFSNLKNRLFFHVVLEEKFDLVVNGYSCIDSGTTMNNCGFHSAPAVIVLSSVILNASVFLYRSLCVKKRDFPSISGWPVAILLLYIVLLGSISTLLYINNFCSGVVVMTALLPLNWIIVLLTLRCGKISFRNSISHQVIVSGLEATATLWFTANLLQGHVNAKDWYYIPVLVSCCILGIFCNALWINSLYTLRREHYHHTLLSHGDDSNQLSNSKKETDILRSVLFVWFTRVLDVGGGGGYGPQRPGTPASLHVRKRRSSQHPTQS